MDRVTLLVTRCWSSGLERGLWYEISHGPRNLITGFVFVTERERDYRDIDGSKLRRGTDISAWDAAINRYEKDKTP